MACLDVHYAEYQRPLRLPQVLPLLAPGRPAQGRLRRPRPPGRPRPHPRRRPQRRAHPRGHEARLPAGAVRAASSTTACDWQLAPLDLPEHRQLALEQFTGTLCVDELHLGRYTLLLATDPIADLPVGFALVSGQRPGPHAPLPADAQVLGLRCPQVVVTDGSNLYPAVLAEVWPARQAPAVRLPRPAGRHRQGPRRGPAPAPRLQAAAARPAASASAAGPARGEAGGRGARGPTHKEKAAFVFKHRFLIVKRPENLSEQEWADLGQMFEYLPELRTLWQFSQEVYKAVGRRAEPRGGAVAVDAAEEQRGVPGGAGAGGGDGAAGGGEVGQDAWRSWSQPAGEQAEDEQPRRADQPASCASTRRCATSGAGARASSASCCCGSAATSPDPRRRDSNRLRLEAVDRNLAGGDQRELSTILLLCSL